MIVEGLAPDFVARGEREAAIDLLEQAWEQKDVMLRDLLVDASWDSIRSDKRFAELMQKMNYPA